MPDKYAVYIPTRDRTRYLIRAIRAVHEALAAQDATVPVHVTTARQFQRETGEAITRSRLALPMWRDGREWSEPAKGIGYARDLCVRHANARGYKAIVMIDDDQVIKGDLMGLLAAASRDDVVGIGAWESIHGLFSRGTAMAENYREPGIWLHNGSLGYHCFGLNVGNVQYVGGFDPKLRMAEDVELARYAYKGMNVPWYIYTGISTNGMLRQNPGPEFGGVSMDDRSAESWARVHQAFFDRWGERYISRPPAKYRCRWRNFITDCLNVDDYILGNIHTTKAFDWEVGEK
jgi:hypothetical protein